MIMQIKQQFRGKLIQLMCEHTFDCRDVHQTRCLHCKTLTNDVGAASKPKPKTIAQQLARRTELVDFCNTTAKSVGILNHNPSKGPVYFCTLSNFGRGRAEATAAA